MSTGKIPQKVKLFASLMYNPLFNIDKVLQELQKKIGQIDLICEEADFNYTRYYEKEMGGNLKRRFVTFLQLVPRDGFYQYKRITADIENEFTRENGARNINIDPGYLCLENLVLLTYKGYAHRIYLDNGVYGDLTLIYKKLGDGKKSGYTALEWSYRDYIENIPLFERIREKYHEELNNSEE